MRRRGDRGEGPVSYIAVILLVAVIAAAVTVVALPDTVTGSVRAAVCRVVGQDCADDPGSAGPQGGSEGSTEPPEPGGQGDGSGDGPGGTGGLSPEEQEYQNALDAYNQADEDAAEVESEWDAFDLLRALGELGLDFLIGDIRDCIQNPNVTDCLFALADIVPWSKLFSFLRKVPRLVRMVDRFMDLRRRLDRAREARSAARGRLDDAIEACTRRTGPGNSFVPGTRVLLADGTAKPIERVEVGDLVWAADPVTGRSGPRPVTALIAGTGRKHLVDLTIDPDGLPGGPTAQLTATAGHLFWEATSRSWLKARDLVFSDRLGFAADHGVLVLGSRERSVPRQRVHNLTVAGMHTYHVIVGGEGVLVHNEAPGERTLACPTNVVPRRQPPERAVNALRGWQTRHMTFGNNQFSLDRSAMTHILQRHHPDYWTGQSRSTQTFFDRSMSIDDIANAAQEVMRQNRDMLINRGTNSIFQIEGVVNGRRFVLGITNGRIGQFYPV